LTELDCDQFVTIGGGFRPFSAPSSDVLEERMPGKFGTYRASSAPSAGPKILVSAVQSSPGPPLFSRPPATGLARATRSRCLRRTALTRTVLELTRFVRVAFVSGMTGAMGCLVASIFMAVGRTLAPLEVSLSLIPQRASRERWAATHRAAGWHALVPLSGESPPTIRRSPSR